MVWSAAPWWSSAPDLYQAALGLGGGTKDLILAAPGLEF
jgi:hypothetical protein